MLSNFGLGEKAQFFLEDPRILVGLFFGGIIVHYFSSSALSAVSKPANKAAKEVKRQLEETSELIAETSSHLPPNSASPRSAMEGKSRPEYSKRINIITKAVFKEMIMPAFLLLFFPILIGFILGPEALGGFLIGSIIVGIFLATRMTTVINPMIKLLTIVALLIIGFLI